MTDIGDLRRSDGSIDARMILEGRVETLQDASDPTVSPEMCAELRHVARGRNVAMAQKRLGLAVDNPRVRSRGRRRRTRSLRRRLTPKYHVATTTKCRRGVRTDNKTARAACPSSRGGPEYDNPERRGPRVLLRMNDAYQEHLLNATDVCSNCLRIIRIERVDPARSGMIREYESHYERNPRTTEIAYGPADSVTNVKGTFCDRCGTESPDADDRVWTSERTEGGTLIDTVDDERFETLVKQAIATLDYKDVSIQPRDFAAHALQHRKDDATVDEALGAATEAAIVASARDEEDAEAERV